MSRFDHLEMGDWKPRPSDMEPEDSGIIDQHYYLEKATNAFADENYERALSYFSRALQYDINLEEAWVGQLRCLIELQELQEAIIWSDRALERFPSSGQILAARAVAESRLGRPIAAMSYSDAAIGSRGESPYIWVARGEVLIPANPTNAKACFDKALELAPQDWAVRSWIARAWLVRGCHHLALEHLRHAVRLDPNRFTCWYWIGKCCEAFGEIEEAKRSYRRALAAQPAFTRARDAIRRLEHRGLLTRLADAFKRLFAPGQVSEG